MLKQMALNGRKRKDHHRLGPSIDSKLASVCAILTQHENGIPCNGPWPFPLSWPLSRAALVLASLHAMLL